MPDAEWALQLASMVRVALIGFAVGGAFLSLAYWDMPFYYMLILVVTQRWVKDRLAEERSRPAGAAPVEQPDSPEAADVDDRERPLAEGAAARDEGDAIGTAAGFGLQGQR